jgi:hypothetical protein
MIKRGDKEVPKNARQSLRHILHSQSMHNKSFVDKDSLPSVKSQALGKESLPYILRQRLAHDHLPNVMDWELYRVILSGARQRAWIQKLPHRKCLPSATEKTHNKVNRLYQVQLRRPITISTIFVECCR